MEKALYLENEKPMLKGDGNSQGLRASGAVPLPRGVGGKEIAVRGPLWGQAAEHPV